MERRRNERSRPSWVSLHRETSYPPNSSSKEVRIALSPHLMLRAEMKHRVSAFSTPGTPQTTGPTFHQWNISLRPLLSHTSTARSAFLATPTTRSAPSSSTAGLSIVAELSVISFIAAGPGYAFDSSLEVQRALLSLATLAFSGRTNYPSRSRSFKIPSRRRRYTLTLTKIRRSSNSILGLVHSGIALLHGVSRRIMTSIAQS